MQEISLESINLFNICAYIHKFQKEYLELVWEVIIFSFWNTTVLLSEKKLCNFVDNWFLYKFLNMDISSFLGTTKVKYRKIPKQNFFKEGRKTFIWRKVIHSRDSFFFSHKNYPSFINTLGVLWTEQKGSDVLFNL